MRKGLWVICIVGILIGVVSCQSSSEEQRQEVDLLNHRAFNSRYTSLDSVEANAKKALQLSKHDAQGMAESYNNLGLAAYMRQDFIESERCYNLAKEATRNQIEQLISDIGMLKVCVRASENKRFYDYETQIRIHLNQLYQEKDALNEHDLTRLIFAESDFHLTASIYYYYMQQDDKACQELQQIDGEKLAQADSLQWTYYEYMLASVDMLGGETYEDDVKQEFDTLLRILFYSREKNLIYMEANVLEAFVEKFSDPNWKAVAYQSRQGDFPYLNTSLVPDSLFLEDLSKRAIACFQKYGDYYQIAGARRGLAEVYFSEGKYEKSLAELEHAIQDINLHYKKYNFHSGYKRLLQSYSPNDTLEVDLKWMANDSISTVPQWLANIRQSLSLAYSGIGNKPASDYNRNIYLDLLDKTRQDKEQESRMDQLKAERHQLNLSFYIIAIFTVLGIIALVHLNRRWRKRNALRINKLNASAELCNYISSSIPTDVENPEDLLQAMKEDIEPRMNELFGCDIQIEKVESPTSLKLLANHDLNSDDRNLLSLIEPYLNWAFEYGNNFLDLEEKYQQLEKEKYLHEQHIADNKRRNLEKRTCMSIVTGITPFMDRALNEINRLGDSSESEAQKKERYLYIQELIDRINEYNDIMALWIQMKRGALSLQIESFLLADIFTILAKGKRSFESKNQELIVDETTSVVKADKALTLFMVNTLCENARKYTPEGGTVHIYSEDTQDYVEISVKDNGRGLTEEDRKMILEEKVYDSSKIGMQATDSQDLKKNKGFGFGLMNCKGIIDKYKKTNSLFSVCQFGIESELGKGSRFFFRLPKGIVRLILLLLCFSSSLSGSASAKVNQNLQKATAYADSTYYCNVDGLYEDALMYADSACYYLNQAYLTQYSGSNLIMSMKAAGKLAELDWWEKSVNTDYHVILDIRNEAAIAALALRQWDVYRVNNEGYTRLYKLLGEDTKLNTFCEQMQKATSNRMISFVLFILLILIFLVAFYSLYFRQSLLYRINVQQVLEANRKVLGSFSMQQEQDDISSLLRNMLQRIFPDLNAIHPTEGLAILLRDSEENLLLPIATNTENLTEDLQKRMKYVLENQEIKKDKKEQIYPLLIKLGGETSCIGSFAFLQEQGLTDRNEEVLKNLIISYMSIVIYQTVIRLSRKHQELEEAEDEKSRAIHEENLLHVQNMVLDNCLSTLKHETMYYPNRIKLIVEKLQGETDKVDIMNKTRDMGELMSYYKDIFSTLSGCANRQLENVMFSRKRIEVCLLQKHLQAYFKKVVRKRRLDWELDMEISSAQVLGDENLLDFMMENLVDASLEISESATATFKFSVQRVDGFIRFDWEDPRGIYEQQDLNLWFYPSLERMKTDESGVLHGTQYLNMRQIIRDHDELCRHRGCRINADVCETGGYRIWFTIPEVKNIR